MKTEAEIRQARSALVKRVITPGLSDEQRTLLQGMSVALQWACGEGGSSLQRLIDGEPIRTEET